MLAEHGVFIVADGMGGHAAGEVASEMAVRITSHQIGSLRGLSDEQAGERVSAAIRAANDAIFERTLAEHDKRGMGTTATVLVLMPQRYLIGQVGDSRAYLLRQRRVPAADQGPLLRAGAGRCRTARPRSRHGCIPTAT